MVSIAEFTTGSARSCRSLLPLAIGSCTHSDTHNLCGCEIGLVRVNECAGNWNGRWVRGLVNLSQCV